MDGDLLLGDDLLQLLDLHMRLHEPLLQNLLLLVDGAEGPSRALLLHLARSMEGLWKGWEQTRERAITMRTNIFKMLNKMARKMKNDKMNNRAPLPSVRGQS